MAEAFEWDRGLFSSVTVEFDRALQSVRNKAVFLCNNPVFIAELAKQLKEQPGITRREFDRRFRLIVSAAAKDDSAVLQAIAKSVRDTSPEALNAVRALLPSDLRHLAVLPPANPQPKTDKSQEILLSPSSPGEPTGTDPQTPQSSRFDAVALIGTMEEHVRNKALLKEANLIPVPLANLDQLLDIVNTGLCGFVIGASAWGHVKPVDQRRAIRRLCEYSTFLFVRVCVDGLSTSLSEAFLQVASDARCGHLDGKRFCHGQDCELTHGDIKNLQSIARFLEESGAANFYPMGLSESDASLLRLIAADRRHATNPLTIRKLSTRELAGGASGARVFLLNDGISRSFVAKVDRAEQLNVEYQRYQKWIANWEPGITEMTFHSHLDSFAISYRLQAAPDGFCEPAPTLDECLERLRLSEWVDPIEKVAEAVDDVFQALTRAIDRLVILNSRRNPGSSTSDFWLDRPIRGIAERGIDIALLDQDWQPMMLSDLINRAMALLEPKLTQGIIHGDLHGRNLLLLDRLPAFIDFALSGPGHPLEDLVRLDAIVRSACMRMLIDEHASREIYKSVYVDGASTDAILNSNQDIAASPLTSLAIRVAIKVREASLLVAQAHSLGLIDLFAMICVVSGHMLVSRDPGSGIERVLLSVLGARLQQA